MGTKKDTVSAPPQKEVKKKSRAKATKKKARVQKKKAAIAVKKSGASEPMKHITIQDSTPKSETVPFNTDRMKLALLSPLRLPVQYDAAFAQAARVAGMSFVVVGAMFALINIQTMNGAYGLQYVGSQLAQLTCSDPYDPQLDPPECESSGSGDSMDPCDPGSIMYDPNMCTTGGGGGNGAGTGSNPEPPVAFALEGDEPYSGNVTITYEVESANNVQALVFYRDELDHIFLGYADQTADNRWEFAWDTSQYPDGEYRLKALVHNEHGTYDDTDSGYVDVLNSTNTNDPPPEGDTGGDPGDETAPEAFISFVEQEPLEGRAHARIEVSEANSVNLRIFNDSDAPDQFVGQATYVGDGVWTRRLETENFSDGIYTVYARISNLYGQYDDGHIEIEIQNGDEATTEAEESENTNDTPVLIDETDDPIGVLVPAIELEVSNPDAMHNEESIRIVVDSARFVEVYATRNFGLVPHFIGLAHQHDEGEWRLRFNTESYPNGGYEIFVRVRNQFGLYDSEPVFVTINNTESVEHTFDQEIYIGLANETEAVISEEMDTALDAIEEPLVEAADDQDEIDIDITETTLIDSINEEEEYLAHDVEQLLVQFRAELRAIMDFYAVAIRNDRSGEIEDIQKKIDQLKKDTIQKAKTYGLKDAFIERITQYADDAVASIQKVTERHEDIIKERVGEQVFSDADKDGISDYDEISLYNTDPYDADSDNDGFNDGAEIAGGYDPTDDRPEALVLYESPQEAGVVREDLLLVESITSIDSAPEDVSIDGKTATAVISGKALPNSYVTLYIFSTPIVVTVKTEADGSWQYIFDKELEDGTHEVYAAVTDNAGKIVAKSSSFAFVKTAQAFTPTDAAAAAPVSPTPVSEPALISENVLLAVLSVVVVIIGLVLLLLGFHMRSQKPKLATQ